MSLCKEDLFVTEDFSETVFPATAQMPAYGFHEIMPTQMSLSPFFSSRILRLFRLLIGLLGLIIHAQLSSVVIGIASSVSITVGIQQLSETLYLLLSRL